MNAIEVGRRWFLDHVRALPLWCLGLAGVTALYLGLYQTYAAVVSDRLTLFPSALLDLFGLTNILVPTEYVHTTVFGLIGIVILLAYAIGLGGRAIAGTEEEGSLELVVAHAVSRSGILAARAAVLTLLVAIAAAVTGISVVMVSWIVSIDLAPGNVVAVTCAFGLLALVHGYIALAVGAATGRRSWALTAAAGVAVFGYLTNHIGLYLAKWVPKLSPFYWAYHNKPLENGFEVGGLVFLVVGILIALLVAFVGFNRRDLGT